jgi:uncharacterized protein (DUF58 family)
MAATLRNNLIERFDPNVLKALGGLDLKARYLVEGFLLGIHESPFHGLSVEFSEYRDYQPGDDLRHLDWRLYARSDRLYVKKYTQETNVRTYILCDASGSMGYRGRDAWGSKLDAARTVAAAMCRLMLDQNDAVGLLAMSARGAEAEFIRPSQKPSQFGTILHHLEQLEPAGGRQLAALLDHAIRLIHRRSIILFFSDFLEPAESIATALAHLRFLGHECLIFQVLDRDETEFPFGNDAVFEDLENGQRRSVAPAAVRELYLQRFGAFMDQHRAQFRLLEMPYCPIRTDREPWEALALFLSERRRLQ